MTPMVIVHRDPTVLAAAAAARMITKLVDAQALRESATLVVTGGGACTATLAAIASSPALAAVDWTRVNLWWGDERFLPAGDEERNETAARRALLDHVPLDPGRVHPMPTAEDGLEPEEAADRYAAELADAAGSGSMPEFDVVLLGVGPDGHVASLFPGEPGYRETDRPVVAVREAPKPPPTRISLTLPVIRSAAEVWLVVSGEDKAPAVRAALKGSGDPPVPAAAATGRQRTVWLLDRAAASQLDVRSRSAGAP